MMDPTRKYEINGQVSTLKTAFLAGGTGNNQTVLAAITGERIRIMGLVAQSSTSTEGSFNLKSASGGATLFPAMFAPANNAGKPFELPVTDSGYFETVAGEGLFADIVTAAVTIAVFYVTYTP